MQPFILMSTSSALSTRTRYVQFKKITLQNEYCQEKCHEDNGCEATRFQLRITAEYVCGGKYNVDHGLITSPFYPNNYIPSEACMYDIV